MNILMILLATAGSGISAISGAWVGSWWTKKKALHSSSPGYPADGEIICPHSWAPWEACEIGDPKNWFWGPSATGHGTTRQYKRPGQRRHCTMCGLIQEQPR